MTSLKQFMDNIPPGQIQDTTELEKKLAECWDQLSDDEGGMEGYKLKERMENVSWDPPILEFTIERHGAFVQGSNRAELQEWGINVEEMTVSLSMNKRYRQLKTNEPRLNVEPLAETIAELILNGKNDDRLKWINKDKVRVLISQIIPEGNTAKQTLTSRRKRFRLALIKKIKHKGWHEVSPNVYQLKQ